MKIIWTKFLFDKTRLLKLIMRTFIFFYCIVAFSVNPSNGFSQNAKIKINKDTEFSVVEIFKLIQSKTEYEFVYRYDLVKEAPTILVEKGEVKIGDLLRKGLNLVECTYEFKDENTIIVKRKLVAESIKDSQEKILIKGIVTDEAGEPLVGVNVASFKMSKKSDISLTGTSTDFDGKFELLSNIGDELQFSYVGYIAQSIKVDANTKNLNIVLEVDANQLEEVIISTGYQKLSKERTTGAFSKINTDKLDQRPITNITDRLEGTVAGLNIVIDPVTNESNIQIRGQSTLFADAKALIVVDGFPIEGDLSTINPQDIESVTVLKDATAASIWGVKASNGVVVIVTKKGKAGKLSIDFSNYVSITEKIDYSKMDYLSTSNQIDMALEYYNKGWFGPDLYLAQRRPITAIDEGYLKLKGLHPSGDVWSSARFNSFTNQFRNKDASSQWEKYLLRNQLRNTYNLSISGGAENNSFYGSLVYNDQSFASIGTSSDEVIMNLNNTYKFNDKLTFNAGVNVLFNQAKDNGVNPGDFVRAKPFEELVDARGNLIQYYTTRDRWTSVQRESIEGIGSYSFNQIEEQRNTDKTNQRFSVRAKFGAEYKISENLKVASNFQYERGSYDTDQYNSMNLPSHRINVFEFTVNGVNRIPLGTEYSYSRENFYSWNFRNTLTWNKDWEDHKLNVFAGTEIKKDFRNQFSNRIFGYDKQSRISVPVDQLAFSNGTVANWAGDNFLNYKFYEDSSEDRRVFSMFSNVGYQFLNKYSANASFRIDQTNLFGSDPSFRYKPLWSVGLGWDITKEDFMSDVSYVNSLKLRGTYGLVGNAGNKFSPFALAGNRISSLGNNTHLFLQYLRAANEKLKWEETSILNLAVDFSLFNRRLSGSLEYYAKNSQDLLGEIDFDPTVGFSSGVVNYASMTNNGVELELNGVIIDKENFKWKSNLNFSYNSNKVTEIDREQTTHNILFNGKLSVGESANNIYAIDYAGVSNTGEMLIREPDGTIKSWKQKDYASFPVNELVKMGKAIAPYYGGFSNTFSYNGLDLTVNLTYKFGHKFRREVGDIVSSYGGVTTNGIWANRWQKPGDELTTRVPGIAYNGLNPYSGQQESLFDNFRNQYFYQFATDHVYDASFIRVRDIVLGYTLPESLIEKTFFKSFKVTGQLTNPFLWVANKPGLDPEAHTRMAFDNLKTLTLGIKANF